MIRPGGLARIRINDAQEAVGSVVDEGEEALRALRSALRS